MRVRVGDVIEPAALRRHVAYREFSTIEWNKLPHNYEPKVYSNELMFQAGGPSRCKRNERAKRAHSLYSMNLL